MDAFGRTSSQKVLNSLRAMDTGPIPHDQQFAWDLTHDVAQKAYHIAPVMGFLLNLHQQLTVRCDRTDRRQVVITTRRTQDGWLTDRRPTSHQCGQQVEGSFVYPD